MSRALRRRSPFVIGAAIIAAITLGVAGCTADGGDGGGGGGDAGRYVNIFTGAPGQLSENFNPFVSSSNQQVKGTIFEPLFLVSRVKAGPPEAWLGTEYTVDETGTVWEITLRDDVAWHDGEAFTADDVAFTYNLIRDVPELNENGLNLVSAEATDDTHVTITTGESYLANFDRVIAGVFIVPEHIWKDIDAPALETATKPVGTGAFAFEQFTPQFFTVKANADYYEAGKPYVPGLRFVTSTGNTAALNSLIAGEIDWAGIAVPDVKTAFLDKEPEFNHATTVPGGPKNIELNLTRKPFDDLAFRQALSMSINRERHIAEALGEGNVPVNATGIQTPRDEIFVPKAFAGKGPEEDADKAREILEDAGYTWDGDGKLHTPDGTPVSIEVKTVTGWNDLVLQTQILVEEWGNLGIDVTGSQQSWGAFSTDRAIGDFDVIPYGYATGPTPFTYFETALSSKYYVPIGESATSNVIRFKDAKVDDLLATAARTTDEKTLIDVYNQLGTIMAEQMPYIQVSQNGATTMFRTQFFTGFPTDDDLWADPSNWEAPNIGVVAKELKPVK